jgi:hypothetical protein
MKHQRYGLTAAAVLCLGVSVAAHSSQPDAKPTTIVGCLVQGLPSSGTDRAADAASTDKNDFFVRTPTIKIPPGASVAVGAPGTTSTATGTPADDSFYRVEGLTADQLRPHLRHRVELQGRLTDNTPGILSSQAKTTQDKEGRATTTVETRIAIAGVLHATTIKMVSASCEQ